VTARVLVVEDDPGLRRALDICLRAAGYDVELARDGVEALMWMSEARPDLILADVVMPGIDGHALLRRLRAAPRTAQLPVVLLSARSRPDDRAAGYQTGADVYLTKPFEPEELVAVLGRLLARSRAAADHGARDRATRDPLAELTAAERQIAQRVAAGLTNKAIASERNLSVRTVENHVGRILGKLGLSNRVELARHVLDAPRRRP
jgi:DNA-binding NarL/FixJ family response regulator